MSCAQPVQKSFYLFQRRASLSRSAFASHWFQQHAELLLSIPDFVQRRCAYVQNHVAAPLAVPGLACSLDGVTQVCVRAGAQALPPFPNTAAYQSLIVPDEQRFLDRDESTVFKTLEQVLLPGEGPCKLLLFVRRAPGASIDEFPSAWLPQALSALMDDPAWRPVLRGLRLNRRVGGECRNMAGAPVPEVREVDAAIELWFESAPAAQGALASAGQAALFQGGRCTGFVADARAILP